MTTWSIDSASVAALLGGVQTCGEDLSTGYGKVGAAFEDLVGALVGAPGIAEAINGVLESDKTHFENTTNRVAAAIFGASTAVNLYVHADLDMAATAQSEAAKSAASGDFTYFTK